MIEARTYRQTDRHTQTHTSSLSLSIYIYIYDTVSDSICFFVALVWKNHVILYITKYSFLGVKFSGKAISKVAGSKKLLLLPFSQSFYRLKTIVVRGKNHHFGVFLYTGWEKYHGPGSQDRLGRLLGSKIFSFYCPTVHEL